MTYQVSSSERLRPIGAETETKALLYLMNFSENRNEIYYFVIDFFNDVTAMSSSGSKIWDLQSKGKKNSTPKEIGRELVTLFKNYESEFQFDGLILFLDSVSSTVRVDGKQNVFTIDNITETAKLSIIKGLKEEANKKEYINNSSITEASINSFLNSIVFVVNDKSKADYIREIIVNHPKIVPDDNLLNSIFEELKKIQSSKKDMNIVEGVSINYVDEALNFNRHLTKGEIELLTLQRIINRNPISDGAPISFLNTINYLSESDKRECIEECQRKLVSALFNKNATKEFWNLFSNIYTTVIDNVNDDVQSVFAKIDHQLIESHPNFDILSVKYFISVLKEGLY